MKSVISKSSVPFVLFGMMTFLNGAIYAGIMERGWGGPITPQISVYCNSYEFLVSNDHSENRSRFVQKEGGRSCLVKGVQNKQAQSVYLTLTPEGLLEQAESELKKGHAGQAYITAGKALSLLIMRNGSGKADVRKSEYGKRAISIMRRAAKDLVKNNPTNDTKTLTLGGSYHD